jgi:predicted transcriptional regulator
MATDREPLDREAIEDVAYLSRSATRIRVLDALARGAYSRRELDERTEASRTTLDRIVNELEDRGWAARRPDGDYEATATGRRLVAETVPFVGAVAAIRRLGEAVAWLPEDLSIGLHHFQDAVVRRPGGGDPIETGEYFVELFQETTAFRVLTNLAAPGPVGRALRDRVVSGEMTAECVITEDVVDLNRESPERSARWREMLQAGADVFAHPGPIPCNLYVFEDTVLVKKGGPKPIDDAYGVPIQSENEAVVSWAHRLLDECRADATRLPVETFADEAPAADTDPQDP